ncbi:MAG: recombinase family protein [Candidatus Acidiferrum sp.]
MVLFWKLDRFSREGVRKTLRHLRQVDDWGVGWRSFQEPFFDSCGMMRDVVISIMATLAEQERITISERTKAGLARTRKASTRRGRRPAQVDYGVGGEAARWRRELAAHQEIVASFASTANQAAQGCSSQLN